MVEPNPPLDRPDLWALQDARKAIAAALSQIEKQPRFTECGRLTPSSIAYLEQVKAIEKLVRTVL